MKPIRTRFAPSPTGFMHVGGIRTALFAWALAKGGNGQFILRIEDTDKAREVEGSVDHIIEALDWLGMDRDEGPVAGGEHGPYKQSERVEIYKKYAQQLIDAGHAYIDPFTPEQIDEFRTKAREEGRPFLYRQHRPEGNEVVPEDWHGKHTLRFKTPEIKRYNWHDEVRGRLKAGEEALDDFVLVKADGLPTYNFAHVVDDHDMQITHIIRGEEFIPSTPKFLSLYEALEIEAPLFVTVPPILNKDGGKKLSKRDGARDVLEYRDEGYAPASVVNFLASLGWNDGSDREVYSPDEIKDAFSIDRVQKSGAKFDETKLEWFEWQHLSRRLAEHPEEVLAELGMSASPDALELAASKSNSREILKDQLRIFTEQPEFSLQSFDLKQVDKKLDLAEAERLLRGVRGALSDIEFTPEQIEQTLRAQVDELDTKARILLNLVRWSVSGQRISPGLFEMLAVIGREQVLVRLDNALR